MVPCKTSACQFFDLDVASYCKFNAIMLKFLQSVFYRGIVCSIYSLDFL